MSVVPALRGCFVTGTDTGVGKTFISAALLQWCSSQGWRSAGFKPVAAGTELMGGEQINEDVFVLRQASSMALSADQVGPCQFKSACAPHIAAELEGRTISRQAILESAQALAKRSDLLVVEGVGGFCVPLGPNWDSADLAQDLGLPVILVVGLRLGCINHSLLTAQAIAARGLRLAGWIGNRIDPGLPWAKENSDCLTQWLAQRYGAPCLGIVRWLAQPQPNAIVQFLDPAALTAIFKP